MAPDLPDRAQLLFDRIKEFPEAKWTDDGLFLKKEAGTSFLNLRQMVEREIIPALDELRRQQR